LVADILRHCTLAALTALSASHLATAAPQAVGPASRSEATAIVADMRRVVVPGGIERLEKIRIGGIDQWVSIRGNDPGNPVLLMIHGGPGWVSMPTSWYFQRGWEEYFTVVQWDQRGAGKTYADNDPAVVAPTMTPERIVADAEEVAAWLRKEFGKEKIVVLGHSWGSFVGLSLARKRPKWLHAYVGVGQVINTAESERRGWRFAMERATADENEVAIDQLRALAPYAADGRRPTLEHLEIQRRWLNHYGGMVHARTGGQAEAAAIRLSPEYRDRDVALVWEANAFSVQHLLPEVLQLDLSDVVSLDCPVVLFLGRHDFNVSSTVAAEWFERVKAPAKQLVWFEHSAHEVFNEEPGRFLVSLVNLVRPLANRKDQSAPWGR
jgi:proline iminopeptidase